MSLIKNKINKKILNKIKLQKPFVEKDLLHNIFSWLELENLLNLRPFITDSRFHIARKPINEHFEWPMQSWLSDINTFPPKLLHNIVEERVCSFSDASRVNKSINEICGIIETATRWPTDAHIYFSKKVQQEGFGKHKDEAHNLIVQVEGKSNFQVWSIDNKIIIDEDMLPGDCVFIPAHINHKILPCTPRISVSFPMWLKPGPPPQDRYWINF